MTTTLEGPPRINTPEQAKYAPTTEQATASSAHARINIPLNLENWKHLPQEVQDQLLWFHQYILDRKLPYPEAEEALDYDESTVFKILKGTYEGSWTNVCKKIISYRRTEEIRGTIQQAEFVENSVTRLIFGGLDYALANNSVAIVIGESGQGKSISGKTWKERNNHGRSVLVIAPAYGGTKALLRDIAAAVGVNKNYSAPAMHESILRAFNKNRILIVDEAHRLLPGDRRTNPVNLEILRDIHDRTGCSLALLATARFDGELRKSDYMFEQLLGRARIIKLPKKFRQVDIDPILRQYVSRPGKVLAETCLKIANELGRVRFLVEILKVASRIAKKASTRPADEHIFKAIKLVQEMQGGF
jgi:DNA transposition AAA+ family ATPase